jgi:hypothetical protein
MTMRAIRSLLAIWVCVALHAQVPELAPPVEILAGGKPIDVPVGHVSPFLADWDGDGLDDLFTGQLFYGRFRVYRNLGTATAPRYEDFEFLRAGGTLACLPSEARIGTAPKLADLDGDGHRDLLSGCCPSRIFVFPGDGEGGFRAPRAIRDAEGQPLDPGRDSCVFAADWDRDGDLDLVCGNASGHISLCRNEGPATAPAFAQPVRFVIGERPLSVPRGDSTPCVADWDGDGHPDIVTGSNKGAVYWYRNPARDNDLELEKPVVLVPPKLEVGEKVIGIHTHVAVADWNGDGLSDLLVGDRQDQKVRRQPEGTTAEDRKAATAAFLRLKELDARWNELLDAPVGEAAEAAARSAALRELVDEIARNQDLREKGRFRLFPDSRLWVFIRRRGTPSEH